MPSKSERRLGEARGQKNCWRYCIAAAVNDTPSLAAVPIDTVRWRKLTKLDGNRIIHTRRSFHKRGSILIHKLNDKSNTNASLPPEMVNLCRCAVNQASST